MRLKTVRIAMLLLAGAGLCAQAGWGQKSTHGKKKPSASTKASGTATKTSSATGKSGRRGKLKRTSSRSRRENGQKTPMSSRIIEIQQSLVKNGVYTGEPNGKWDASTVEAMKRFQAGHGLNPSGKLDAKTLQQLGLGSPTAGVAPPAPLVSSVDRLTSSSTQPERRK